MRLNWIRPPKRVSTVGTHAVNLRNKIKTLWELQSAEIIDWLFIIFAITFSLFVIWEESAHLSAPTVAVSTALVASIRTRKLLKKVRSAAVGTGVVVTGFLWMLSTTEPMPDPPMTTTTQAWIILIGWNLTAVTILGATLGTTIPRNYFTRIPTRPLQKKIKDYAIGIILSTTIHILTIIVLDHIDHVIAKPGELQEAVPYFLFIGIMHGWLLTHAARNQTRSRWYPLKERQGI